MPLTPEQLLYADKLLELRVLRSRGQSYEDFFVQVMTLSDPDFRPVKPQGSFGDRKNDGFCAKSGKYYQVYSPDALASNISTAISKVEDDFSGLRDYWNTLSPINEFYFVVNDRFNGVYPTIEATLLTLKNSHGLAECRPFLNSDLMRVAMALESRALLQIVGHLPSPECLNDLDYNIFTDVLKHLILKSTTLTPAAILRAPDFNEKLRLNRVSASVSALFVAANFQAGAVDTFFNSHGSFSKTAIRDKVAAIYRTSKESIPNSPNPNTFPGDLIFFQMLQTIAPETLNKHVQDATIVLLAYFFESCDIYEDPNLL